MFGRPGLSWRLFVSLHCKNTCRGNKDEWRRQNRQQLQTEPFSPLHQHQQGALTFALVHQQTAGSPEVDDVVDLEALQVLAHLPALGEFGVGVFEVDLPAGGSGVNVVTKIRLDTKEEQECVCFYLDHQVNDALVVIAGDWSVWTHHQFAVNLGGEVDVLACRGRKHHRQMRVKIKSAIKMCYIKKGNDRQNYLTFFFEGSKSQCNILEG